MNQLIPTPLPGASEAGYTLITVVFLLFLFTIGLSVAVPTVSRQIQLDRERETIERGKQYQRAIQLYYRKFHAYPPTIEALVETNNIRFLRKRYVDPLTRKDDWRPILFGQNKAPTAVGFFGQPLTGIGSTGASTLAGTGPSGAPSGNMSVFGSSIGGNTGSPGFGLSGAPGQSSFSNAGSNPSTQTLGGAGIIGVSPAGSGSSIMAYKKKDRYNEWEFTYDPMTDIAFMQNNATANQPSVGSLVGNGSGPDGTGPASSNAGPTQTGNLPQQ